MVKVNNGQTKKCNSSRSNEKPGVYLERWQVLILLISWLISLGLTLYLTWTTSEKERKDAKTTLAYSSVPKCALTYVPGSRLRSVTPHFLLKNQGPGGLEEVWLRETVYLLEKDSVHECADLPHFEYKLYCGSSASMGSLSVEDTIRINLDPCLGKAFDIFFKKFSGNLVSRFRLTGSALASPEFRKDFFFVIDRENLQYVKPDEYTGGKELIDRVIAYNHYGPKSVICYRFYDFYKNPPKEFYISEDGKPRPWDGRDLPSGTSFVLEFDFDEAVGSGTIKVVWSCDEVVGPRFRHFSSQPGVW